MPLGSGQLGTVQYGGDTAVAAVPDAPPAVVVYPTLIVELAVTTAPLSTTPVWVDISTRLRNGTVRRGRSSELERVSAGTCTLTLNNRDRALDPLNPAGPYFGNLLPNRRIRIRASIAGVIKVMFDGFVENYEQTYVPGVSSDAEAVCVIEASDALALFAQMDYVGNRPVETAGARVNAILNAAGWPATWRIVDTGMTVMAAFNNTAPGDSAISVLEALHMVDATEQGRMYVSSSASTFVFYDRNTLITNAGFTADQQVFGDNLTSNETPYTDIAFDHSRNEVRNAVTVTNPLWGDFTETDSASITAYGRRAYSLTAYDAAGVASRSTARNLLRLHKNAQSRVTSVTVKPGRSTTGTPGGFFSHVLSVGFGQRVGIRRRGGPYTISQSYQVESLTHSFSPRQWVSEFTFGLPKTAETYWLWGTGLWGSTTKWAW